MKRLFSFFLIITFMLIYTPFVHSIACPESKPTMRTDFIMSPYYDCFSVGIDTMCVKGRPSIVHVSNNDCYNRVLVYVAANGSEHELISKRNELGEYVAKSEEYSISDIDVPQEIGAEWTRELYFKDSPKEKIFIEATNLPADKLNTLYDKMYNYCLYEFGHGEPLHRCLITHYASEFEDYEMLIPNYYFQFYFFGTVLITIVILILFKRK